MAETMQFDLVSPERSLTSVQATEVRIPGADGDLTAMPGHAPAITTLRPGILTVVTPSGTTEFAVTGGFAEIGGDSVSVLAEEGYAAADLTAEIYARMLRDARTAEESAAGEAVEAATKLVADMVAIGTHIGIDPNSATFPK